MNKYPCANSRCDRWVNKAGAYCSKRCEKMDDRETITRRLNELEEKPRKFEDVKKDFEK